MGALDERGPETEKADAARSSKQSALETPRHKHPPRVKVENYASKEEGAIETTAETDTAVVC